jgi:hypothetical protein
MDYGYDCNSFKYFEGTLLFYRVINVVLRKLPGD